MSSGGRDGKFARALEGAPASLLCNPHAAPPHWSVVGAPPRATARRDAFGEHVSRASYLQFLPFATAPTPLRVDTRSLSRMARRLRACVASPTLRKVAVPHLVEPSRDGVSNGSGAKQRNARDTRAFPRCETAYTHFELGASSEYRPTAAMAKRYTPRYGVRKE